MKAGDDFSETYEILERLGEGSGGIVYKAYHKRLNQEVVIKRMRSRNLSGAMKRRETDILKKLHHSYLPQVLDFLERDGEVFTVMSYIPGKSFAQILSEGGTFGRNQLMRWGMQISSALNYLHNQQPPVIHGDIKPANIMLTPEGNICLIDFNIAFYLDDAATLGYSNGYSSPEQYISVRSGASAGRIPEGMAVDERSDIYSVGASFYHIATGRKLGNYEEKPDKELLIQYMGEAFAQVIMKATQINPAKRYESARQLFRAFENIPKKDKRYRALLHRQLAVRMSLVALMAGFIVSGGYGINMMKQETVDKYNELVKEQAELIEKGEYEQQEAVYETAADLIPEALESHYQNAYSLYMQEAYKECISFIDQDIWANVDVNMEQARMADVYYLEADSYYRLEEYDKAAEVYELLFEIGTEQPEYYRDYAINLAYGGDENKAHTVLREAIDCGLREDSIFYAQGEIEKAMERYDAALLDFRECANLTDDNTMKARAYLMMNVIYAEKGSDISQREVLLEARDVIPIQEQRQILESLAKIDIELADKSGNDEYLKEAVDVLNKIVDQGWDTYNTYDTLAILYEKLGQIDAAIKEVDIMRDLYGEDYNVYMRYAFLEIDSQELKDNADRDYMRFAEYYEKAECLYKEEMKDNNEDAEMRLLEEVYRQVEEGGWLE